MKNKIIYIVILVIVLMGCNKNERITNLTFKSIDECNNKPQLLISESNRNIYTYCIENVEVEINDKKVDLKNYIESRQDSIDKIIETLTLYDVVYDGGTKIYKGDNITLINCNTLNGNKDVYIGDIDMRHKSNFCKDDNYTFIRTYTIESVEEYNEQQYTEDGIEVTYGNSFKVKLKQFKGKEEIVIINNLWDIKLEKDKTYEFEFMLYDNSTNIEDSAEYIFKNSEIIDVRETNKVELEQIQEEIR